MTRPTTLCVRRRGPPGWRRSVMCSPLPTVDGSGFRRCWPGRARLTAHQSAIVARGSGSVFVGLGVDAVDIPRAPRLLLEHGNRILARVCTDGESAYITSHADGSHQLAVRLAAKEAAFKALAGSLEARTIGWREIEVIASEGGPPSLVFHGRAAARMSELGGKSALLSLTHSDSVAIAVVLIQGTFQST